MKLKKKLIVFVDLAEFRPHQPLLSCYSGGSREQQGVGGRVPYPWELTALRTPRIASMQIVKM